MTGSSPAQASSTAAGAHKVRAGRGRPPSDRRKSRMTEAPEPRTGQRRWHRQSRVAALPAPHRRRFLRIHAFGRTFGVPESYEQPAPSRGIVLTTGTQISTCLLLKPIGPYRMIRLGSAALRREPSSCNVGTRAIVLAEVTLCELVRYAN